jgi:hypothetical protein
VRLSFALTHVLIDGRRLADSVAVIRRAIEVEPGHADAGRTCPKYSPR